MSQMERIFAVDRSIRERGGACAVSLARDFEVSLRQMKRDIEYMRTRLGAPILWNRSKRRYEYSSAWNALAFADEKSFLAFVFLKAILTKYCYVPVFSKETIMLIKEKIVGQYAAVEGKVRYELPFIESMDSDSSLALCQALLKDAPVRITYRDAAGQRSERAIVPLRLINYSGKWYCAAMDSLSREIRVFAVGRMESAKLSVQNGGEPQDPLPLPSEKEIDEFLNSSYGIFKGAPIGEATLRFFGGAARSIRNQEWHPAQRLVPIPSEDGGDIVELTVPAHDWTEILGRALQCGDACEVVAPPELKERWRESIRRMGARAGL